MIITIYSAILSVKRRFHGYNKLGTQILSNHFLNIITYIAVTFLSIEL